MNGHCAKMDLVPMHGVYSYDYKADLFADSATDENYREDNGGSGSMVLPFLKCMRKRYPEYGFCGLKMASACAQAFHRVPGDSRYDALARRIDRLKKRVIFGGLFLDYSFIEAKEPEESKRLSKNLIGLIENMRRETRTQYLPAFVVRFALNGDTSGGAKSVGYRDRDSLITAQLLEAANHDLFTETIPVNYLPGLDYCDNHHPMEFGYEIQAEDAAVIYQQKGFDWWNIKPRLSGK